MIKTYKKSDVTDKLWLLEPSDFIAYFNDISGQWDGNDSGTLEDRAHIANEIVDLLNELQNT